MKRSAMQILAALLILLSPSWVTAALSATPKKIIWISVFPVSQVASYIDAYRKGLSAEGLAEGVDVELITLDANGSPAQLPAVVEKAVGMKPDVIISQGAAVFGLKSLHGIPVVFGFSGDPIAAGLTDNLARPSGSFTGVTFMSVELNSKRLDLLRMAIPQAKKVVLMGDPVHPGVDQEVAASQAAAGRLGVDLIWRPTRSVNDVASVLAALKNDRPDAIVVLPDSVMLESRDQVAGFAIDHRIPTISGWSMFARSNGLLTYGPKLSKSFKRLAYFTARILKGAKPSELPIERPVQLELVINMRTAALIGLSPPTFLVGLADEVID